MSIIRQARNLQKMTDEVMNHIVERWRFNSRVFKDLSLHTLRTIKKCARAEYFMKKILQRLKLTMMYRLRNSRKDISRAILSNATNWTRVIDDLFDTKRMTIQKLRKLDLLHKRSFFSRRKFELAFSNFNSETSNMIITILINALITKTLSTFDFISKKFIIDDRDIIIEDENVTKKNIENENVIDDFDIIDEADTTDDFDITDDFDVIEDFDIIDDSDTIDDFDTTDDFDAIDDSDTIESSDTIEDSDAIDDFDTTEDFDTIEDSDIIIEDSDIIIEDFDIIEDSDIIIEDSDIIIEDFDIIIEDSDTTIEDSDTIIEDSDITNSAFKRRRSDSHDEESCDCRDFDVAWKIDLKRHDNQIQSQRKALLLLSSMMYVNWEICDIHNELLKIAFDLNAHEQRRMINLKLICIWRNRWNLIDIRTRHRLWFE